MTVVAGYAVVIRLRASIVEGVERAKSLRGGRERIMRPFRYAPTAADGESLAPLLLAEMLGPAIIMRSLPAGSGRAAGVAIKLALKVLAVTP